MDVVELWKGALPDIKNKVTGVGIWAALNASVPIILEDDVVVLGLLQKDQDLGGHLKLPQMHKTIEVEVSRHMGRPIKVRVIDGWTVADWERVKRRDIEAKRLAEIAETKARAEIASKTNWDGIYEQLGRKYASIQNKTLPQNRAIYFKEAIAMLADARKNQTVRDEYTERNFARCIERLSQYSEVPSAIVAMHVMQLTGEM